MIAPHFIPDTSRTAAVCSLAVAGNKRREASLLVTNELGNFPRLIYFPASLKEHTRAGETPAQVYVHIS